MSSSLAAALAASKKDAAKPTEADKNKLPSNSSSSSRPSSLMKYKQTHEVEKRNNTGEEDTSKATSSKTIHVKKKGSVGTAMKNNDKCNSYSNNLEIIDDNTDTNINLPQREKHNTNKSIGKVDTKEAPTSAASVMVCDTATAGVVFVCHIPSDSDDEVVDNCKAQLGSSVDDGRQNNTGKKVTNKKRGDRKKNRRSNANANASDSDIINSPAMSEVVFLCDIPSDDSDDDDDNKNKINHRDHRNDTRYRGRGRGRGRGEKDVAVRNVNSRNDDIRHSGGVPSRTGNINSASPTKGNERIPDRSSTTPLPTTSTGLMPTPWSTRAQGMKNNGTENRTTNPHIRHNNRPDSHSDRQSTDRSSAQEWRSPIMHDDSNPTPSSSVGRASTQKNSTTTVCKGAAATPIKLEPTVLKGRWADEDSESDDE
ncbi:hypothetical protein ACHAXH_003989 [Discostella pseudostelligera]